MTHPLPLLQNMKKIVNKASPPPPFNVVQKDGGVGHSDKPNIETGGRGESEYMLIFLKMT